MLLDSLQDSLPSCRQQLLNPGLQSNRVSYRVKCGTCGRSSTTTSRRLDGQCDTYKSLTCGQMQGPTADTPAALARSSAPRALARLELSPFLRGRTVGGSLRAGFRRHAGCHPLCLGRPGVVSDMCQLPAVTGPHLRFFCVCNLGAGCAMVWQNCVLVSAVLLAAAAAAAAVWPMHHAPALSSTCAGGTGRCNCEPKPRHSQACTVQGRAAADALFCIEATRAAVDGAEHAPRWQQSLSD